MAVETPKEIALIMGLALMKLVKYAAKWVILQ
jgi:hypothetical protein